MIELECPNCQGVFEVNPRSRSWTGSIRTEASCPHCKFKYRDKRYPKGFIPTTARVELLTLSDGRHVALEDYDTTIEEAQTFAAVFRSAWEQVPSTARDMITRYWSGIGDAPHVWLLNDREDWSGKGWAAATPEDHSLCFLATVATRIPTEHVQLFVAHELAHTLCIATGEPTHALPSMAPGVRQRCEWLVWQLMEAWGLDQLAAETWMHQHVDESGPVPRLRETPLDPVRSREEIEQQHRAFESRLADKSIPHQLRPWLAG